MVRNAGPREDVFAVLKLEQEEFNTYDEQVPSNGVPCLKPLPTLILGVG